MDILTLGLGRGLELGRQDVPGLKNTGVNFLASGCRGPICPVTSQGYTLLMRFVVKELAVKSKRKVFRHFCG